MGYRSVIAAASLTLAGVLALASTVAAAPPPKQFLALLNEPQEVPPNPGTATGIAHLTFSESDKLLCLSLTYEGLSGAETDAHIHGPALPGVDGGILFGLALGNPKKQCVGPLINTEKRSLLKNELYINIHTALWPAGEIRGQILRIK
jgi:CHRD domain